MKTSLKDLNRPALTMVVVANVVTYFVILFGLNVTSLSSILSDYEAYIPATLFALLVGILNAQLAPDLKARLVFWRWKNPLPGSYAFTKVMEQDARIDPQSLRSFVDPLPTDPVEQNRLWFKWYREVQDEQSVRQVHREYLFTRDWSTITVLFGLVLIPLAVFQMDITKVLIWSLVVIAQYALVSRAARNHGNRFVASVLANKGSTV